jgi:ligand-binding SRPBCC domain-containing protein
VKLFQLHRVQDLPIDLDTAWAFFSDPANLSQITPAWLALRIASGAVPEMHPGLIIEYRVHHFSGFQTGWITEITHVDRPHLFVDEQRFGPYRFWHHLHQFHPIDAGVRMTDRVHYALGLGPVGRLVERLYVRSRLEAIFDFRRDALSRIFQ